MWFCWLVYGSTTPLNQNTQSPSNLVTYIQSLSVLNLRCAPFLAPLLVFRTTCTFLVKFAVLRLARPVLASYMTHELIVLIGEFLFNWEYFHRILEKKTSCRIDNKAEDQGGKVYSVCVREGVFLKNGAPGQHKHSHSHHMPPRSHSNTCSLIVM